MVGLKRRSSYVGRHRPYIGRHRAPQRSRLGTTAGMLALAGGVIGYGIVDDGVGSRAEAEEAAVTAAQPASASSARSASWTSALLPTPSLTASARASEARFSRAATVSRGQAARQAAAAKARSIEEARRDPRSVAKGLIGDYGWDEKQFSCLLDLWEGESNWRWWVANPVTGAYGIAQSLPAEKMNTVGRDWRTNPRTQIRWGMNYIDERYGTPCKALSSWQARSPHWY